MRFILLAFIVLFFPPYVFCATTLSFTNTEKRGSFPNTLTLKPGKMVVDLSGLPSRTRVFRATLVPNRKGNTYHYSWNDSQYKEIVLKSSDGQEFRPSGPDFLTFDVTSAVRKALSSSSLLELTFNKFPFLGNSSKSLYADNNTNAPVIRLDVSSDATSSLETHPVQNIGLLHSNGGTLIHWRDPDSLIFENNITPSELVKLRKQQNNPHEIRYRIYRSFEPIEDGSIHKASLIGETDCLSIYDWRYFGHGHYFSKLSKGKLIPRYPIADGVLADGGMGMFVYSPDQGNGNVYYAVTRVVDGQEDFSKLQLGENSTSKPIKEKTGSGLVLLRELDKVTKWYYIPGESILKYYVKWEKPPNFNVSEPFDYLVVEPEKLSSLEHPPLSLALHQWGGWLNSGWVWSYNLAQYGALHVSTNQHPYDWWTGFHENLGTLKPLTKEAGYVQPYTQRRIISFLEDFVIPHWRIDRERILLHGNSMGGTGASLWGIRQGEYFSNLISMVGVHVPNQSPQFKGSFEAVYGKYHSGVLFSENNKNVWVYLDNVKWLNEHLLVETPHISFSNGRNDQKIGWPQAWRFARALEQTKRPFTFKWGMRGHGERPYNMGGVIDFCLHQSVPAFADGTLNDNLGDSPSAAVNVGQINYYYLWKTETIVDTQKEWGIDLFLRQKAPADRAFVNVTPRRLQQFKTKPATVYHWKNVYKNQVLQEGDVVSDKYGLVTVPAVLLQKDPSRLIVTEKSSASIQQDNLEVVSGLRVTDVENYSLTLQWHAAAGTAYQIRYSEDPLTEKNWAFADRVPNPPLPQSDGSLQSLTLKNLFPGKKYYFAIRTMNSSGVAGPLSELISYTIKPVYKNVTVTNTKELYDTIKRVKSYTRVTLTPGTYVIDKEIRLGPNSGRPLTDVVLQGVPGQREKVVLQGNGMENSKGANILLKLENVENTIIQHLTIRDAYYHLIQVKGESGAQNPKIKDVHFIDAGQQFLKVTQTDGGVVENCLFEFTDHAKLWNEKPGGTYYYTKAIDLLKGTDGWRISHNTFKRIRAPHGDPMFPEDITKAAIEVWHNSKDTIVENNLFINCDRGIFFGNTSGDRIEHRGGIIRNNIIYRVATQKGDTGIALNKTTGVKVLNNTVVLNGTFPWNIEYRRFSDGKNEPADYIVNNLTDGPIRKRDYGRAELKNNYTKATPDLFIAPDSGNYHLKSSATQVIDKGEPLPEINIDIDSQTRDKKPDIGADEYKS